MNKLFYDPKLGLSSAVAFMRTARERGYAPKDILAFLKRQEATQIHRQVNSNATKFFPMWGRGAGSYQMDMMFMDNPRNRTKLLPILTIINVNSRKLYGYVLKSRSTAEVLNALTKWLNEVKETPHFVQSDNEKAFHSKKVGELLGNKRIIQSFVEPEDHKGQSEVERVHGTLRRLFTLYEEAFHEPWLTGFDELLWNYNHRFHRGIGMEPWYATEDAGLARRTKQYAEAQQAFDKFKVGDRVRKAVFNKDKDKFRKGRDVWSRKVYTIIGTNGFHLFQIDDRNKTFQRHYDLQLVEGEPEKFQTDKPSLRAAQREGRKLKRAARRQRKEGIANFLNPGQAEQLAEGTRAKVAPEVFVAEASKQKAPPKKPVKNPRVFDPDSVKVAEALFKGKYHFVKVLKVGTDQYKVRFTLRKVKAGVYEPVDGQTIVYSAAELKQRAFPIDADDRKHQEQVYALLEV